MARTSFVLEREKPERRYGRDDADFKDCLDEPHAPAQIKLQDTWEFQSAENFVEYMLDDERTEFTTAELVSLSQSTGVHNSIVRKDLESFGLTLRGPQRGQTFRTFGDSNNRWENAESRMMNGGSGGDSISGFVGKRG